MYIYKTTNLVNGKIYIGQTIGDRPNYIGSGRLFLKAVKKYGKENFKREILEYCDNVEQMNEREIIWIAKYDSTNPSIGYNLCGGGGGRGGIHPSTRKKISEANKGEKNPNYKKNFTKEHRQNLSKANKGKKNGPLSEKHRKKLSESLRNSEAFKAANLKRRGQKRTKETRERMSKGMKGVKRSEQAKKNISESLKGRIISDNQKTKLSKSGIVRLDYNYNLIEYFPHITALEEKGFNKRTIKDVIYGHQKTSADSIWMHKETYEKLSELNKQFLSNSFFKNPRYLHKLELEKFMDKRNVSEETRNKLRCSSKKKPIVRLDKSLNLIEEYESAKSAEKQGYGTGIRRCLKGKIKTSGGFIWMYKEDYEKGLNND